jgi:hypothetical protein
MKKRAREVGRVYLEITKVAGSRRGRPRANADPRERAAVSLSLSLSLFLSRVRTHAMYRSESRAPYLVTSRISA